jgi:glycosyltransferase involved in cell wall biosynthesis
MENSPRLALNLKGLSNDKVITSIVIPVFNQESKIIQNIKSILKCSLLPHEIIILNDSSTDGTLNKLITELPKIIELSNFCNKITVWNFDLPVYETQCDVSGIELSVADYILEIQADMKIIEYGFDTKLLKAMQSYPDIIMLSGRGTEKIEDFYDQYFKSLGSEGSAGKNFSSHIFKRLIQHCKQLISPSIINFLKVLCNGINLENVHNNKVQIFPDQDTFSLLGRAGKLGLNINSDIFSEKKKIWLSETVMRGPLFIDKKKYLEVGGFDVEKFFLGFDDHDLAVRSWVLKSYRCGYVPIKFYSPLEDGSTRKSKSLMQEIQMIRNLFRIKNKWKKSSLFNYKKLLMHKPISCEIRNFN